MTPHDDHLIDFIRDRFDQLDATLRETKDAITAHIQKDETYWRQLDRQAGQISLLKWLGGGAGLVALVNWFYEKFMH